MTATGFAAVFEQENGSGAEKRKVTGAHFADIPVPTDNIPYTSRFTNGYGEEWLFEYYRFTSEGILSGSDVDWQPYRVVGGLAPGLVLNDEEIQWLRRAWSDATLESANKTLQ